jgi:hypothetical protein
VPTRRSRRLSWTLIWTPSLTALYVCTDEMLIAAPERAPQRPLIGIEPRITDAKMITLAVLEFASETRWVRHARVDLRHAERATGSREPRWTHPYRRRGTGPTSAYWP